ncbi:MAG TPA: ferredoxin family protein [Methylomirabilota bacterium]|nr:ferredoxin family protein [Methylomirabilota bacterium]
MSIRDEKTLRIVLYEGAGAEPVPAESRFAAVQALLVNGYSVTRTTGERPVNAHARNDVLALGNFGGRAPASGPATDGEAQVQVEDLADWAPETVLGKVRSAGASKQAIEPGAWKPWFPVIDYDRCTNCMQCLSFCLFGVYGVDTANKIQVQNNDNCKTNCPACSRVCPEAAIMFPKYKAGPINGDVVSSADLQREKMKIDISSLLGGDVYSMLRDRSERARSRFSKERDSDKALKERQKCLVKLAESGDIPAEVLMSLPSPEEIARRAEEAKAKAAAALQQNAAAS